MVRNWIAVPPQWLEIHRTSGPDATDIAGLGAGEAEAITLAVELHADLLLMDDRRGVKAARGKGVEITGTLGVLGLAGQRGIIDLAEAFERINLSTLRFATRKTSWTSSSTRTPASLNAGFRAIEATPPLVKKFDRRTSPGVREVILQNLQLSEILFRERFPALVRADVDQLAALVLRAGDCDRHLIQVDVRDLFGRAGHDVSFLV